MPEGEDNQEIENLLEKIMKENVPNLAKEIDLQVQEAQRVPKKLDPRRNTPRHIIIKLPKIKDKENVTYKGVPIRLSADFSRNFAGMKGLVRRFSHGRQGPTSKITLSSKAFI